MAATHIGTTTSKPPISQHPAFPAIVALWFAALLGIGSLVLPATLFESLIVATGLHTVVPAAEPPLGIAARILIALVGAGLGALAGLYIARKVAAAQAAPRFVPAPIRREPMSTRPAKRPISAHEELGADGFDEPVEDLRFAPIPGRRRALSLTEESGPSELLDYAPLPGADAEIVMRPAEESADTEDDALDLTAFADHFPAQIEAPEAVHPPGTPVLPSEEDPLFAPAPVAAEQARPFDVPPAIAVPEINPNEAPGDASAPVDTPRGDLGQAAASAPIGDPLLATESDVAEPSPAEPGGSEDRPLRDLSIAELVDRFAISLQRAAERAEADLPFAEMAAHYVPDLGVEAMEAPRLDAKPAPESAAPAPTEEAAMAPATAAPAEAIPAALRPLALDDEFTDEEHDNLALTLTLSPEARPFASPASEAVAEGHESDDSSAEAAYSSLLSIRPAEREREFVRIEEGLDDGADEAFEPVVVFPGQEERRIAPAAAPLMAPERPFDAPRSLRAAPPAGEMPPVDQAQAERALREALHKLQRLSGAA